MKPHFLHPVPERLMKRPKQNLPDRSPPVSATSEEKATKMKRPEDSPERSFSEEVKPLQKPFSRVWTREDELVLLRQMVAFSEEHGIIPTANTTTFHSLVQKSLSFDVSKNQLAEKVKRLKKKYKNNLVNSRKRFSNAFERETYDLSEQVWGDGRRKGPATESDWFHGFKPSEMGERAAQGWRVLNNGPRVDDLVINSQGLELYLERQDRLRQIAESMITYYHSLSNGN